MHHVYIFIAASPHSTKIVVTSAQIIGEGMGGFPPTTYHRPGTITALHMVSPPLKMG